MKLTPLQFDILRLFQVIQERITAREIGRWLQRSRAEIRNAVYPLCEHSFLESRAGESIEASRRYGPLTDAGHAALAEYEKENKP